MYTIVLNTPMTKPVIDKTLLLTILSKLGASSDNEVKKLDELTFHCRVFVAALILANIGFATYTSRVEMYEVYSTFRSEIGMGGEMVTQVSVYVYVL